MDLPMDTVRKFEIPVAVRPGVLEQLRLMNITRASLFPGLEGYAQSHRQLLFEETPWERIRREIALGFRHRRERDEDAS